MWDLEYLLLFGLPGNKWELWEGGMHCRFRLTRDGRRVQLDVAVDARKYRDLLEIWSGREGWDWGDQ